MIDKRNEWQRSRDTLVSAMKSLGFSKELGEVIAKHLGSPKAIDRMTAYLNYVKPRTEELVVDEMLAIRSEIDAWREKKASEEANAAYNESTTARRPRFAITAAGLFFLDRRFKNDEIDYSTSIVYHYKLRDFLLMDEL